MRILFYLSLSKTAKFVKILHPLLLKWEVPVIVVSLAPKEDVVKEDDCLWSLRLDKLLDHYLVASL